MKTRHCVLVLIFFALLISASLVWADSCPYCGQQYGDAAPGDEMRVQGLRQQHEATCASRPSDTVYGPGYTGYDAGAAARRAEEERIRQEEEGLQIERETARRKRIEDMKRGVEDASRSLEEFEADKKDVLSSLKGSSTAPAIKGAEKMPVINPADLKVKQKGLVIKEVPSPEETRKQNLPIFAKRKAVIILDTLKEHNGDLDKSIASLEIDLRKYPDSYQIKEALSCLEGMRAGSAYEKKVGSPFAAGDEDSSALMEVVAERAEPEWSWSLVKEKVSSYFTAKEGAGPQEDPLEWKRKRTDLFLEALEKGNKDLDKSREYLEKQKEGPNWETARQSLEYLNGFFAYKDYLDKKKD